MSKRPRYYLNGDATPLFVSQVNEQFEELYELFSELAPHNVLDEDIHGDTLSDHEIGGKIRRGDLIVAQHTAAGADIIKWQRFAIGAAHRVLKTTDGVDPIWAQVDLTADVTGILPVANGGSNNSSFTAGSIIFAGAGGTQLTQDNANLFWDDTNDALGILTNTPAYNFVVAGGGLAWFGKGSSSGGFTTLNMPAGTGTTDPTTLTVVSTTGFPSRGVILIESEFMTYTGKTATTFTGVNRGKFNSTNVAHVDGRAVVQISLVNSSDDTSGSSILFASIGRLYVGANGDVFEKGTATAVAALKVGDRFTVGNNGGVSFGDGTQTAFFGIDGTDCYFGARSNHGISFRTNNTGRVFISNSLMMFAGKTAAFCALKRSSTELQVRLADDSAFAPLQCDGLTINAATGNVSYGTYSPTRSAEANLDANITFSTCKWMRIKDTIVVSGRFTADPTAAATATSFEMTLPVASNIGAAEDVSGVAFCGAIAGQGAEIIGVAANDTAKVQWIAGDITSQTWSFTFQYRVI